MNRSVNEVVPELNMIRPGQEVPYHHGSDLGQCPGLVKDTAWRLYQEGKVYLFQRRTSPPTLGQSAVVDWKNGTGTFQYIAVGKRAA